MSASPSQLLHALWGIYLSSLNPGIPTPRLFLMSTHESQVFIFIRIWTPTPECGDMLASSLQSSFLFLKADGVPSGPVPGGTGVSG